jgi:hypothetical protein
MLAAASLGRWRGQESLFGDVVQQVGELIG